MSETISSDPTSVFTSTDFVTEPEVPPEVTPEVAPEVIDLFNAVDRTGPLVTNVGPDRPGMVTI